MNRCKVLKMFHLKATDTIYAPGDVVEVSDEQLAKIDQIIAKLSITSKEEYETKRADLATRLADAQAELGVDVTK